MNQSPLRIAIVGSGTAGPAAAIFLARAGHNVTLFERARERLPVGAGFLLQPSGWSVLHRLGLASAVLPHVAPIHRLCCKTRGGRTLLDLPYAELNLGDTGAGTHRATLLDVLLNAASDAGATLLWGTEILRLARDAARRTVLHDANDHQHGPFDLLLICDGAQSALRAQSGVPARVSRYPWGALWFIGRRTPDFDPHVLWQRVHTTRTLLGFLPTGTRDDLLSVFWSIRMDRVGAWRAAPLEQWKRDVLALAPQAESFLAQVRTHADVAAAGYHDVRMKRWHGEGIAVLGDAAHALSPQLGQGVNLALMDAAALADAIAALPLQQALAHYTALRRRHTRFYQFATRWTTPFFQSDALPLGWVRDAVFPIAQRVPMLRRQMTATMAGIKTGPFSSVRVSAREKTAGAYLRR